VASKPVWRFTKFWLALNAPVLAGEGSSNSTFSALFSHCYLAGRTTNSIVG